MKGEFKSERFLTYGKNCVGARKSESDIMISFINESKGFEYMDILLTNTQAEELIEALKEQIKENRRI